MKHLCLPIALVSAYAFVYSLFVQQWGTAALLVGVFFANLLWLGSAKG